MRSCKEDSPCLVGSMDGSILHRRPAEEGVREERLGWSTTGVEGRRPRPTAPLSTRLSTRTWRMSSSSNIATEGSSPGWVSILSAACKMTANPTALPFPCRSSIFAS